MNLFNVNYNKQMPPKGYDAADMAFSDPGEPVSKLEFAATLFLTEQTLKHPLTSDMIEEMVKVWQHAKYVKMPSEPRRIYDFS